VCLIVQCAHFFHKKIAQHRYFCKGWLSRLKTNMRVSSNKTRMNALTFWSSSVSEWWLINNLHQEQDALGDSMGLHQPTPIISPKYQKGSGIRIWIFGYICIRIGVSNGCARSRVDSFSWRQSVRWVSWKVTSDCIEKCYWIS